MSQNGMAFAVWYFGIVGVSICNQKMASLWRVIFPMLSNVPMLPQQRFVLDGELVIPVGGALSFDELQLRLHPAASRVQKLAAAHPAVYIVFDLLAEGGKSYLKLNLRERRQLLENFAWSNL